MTSPAALVLLHLPPIEQSSSDCFFSPCRHSWTFIVKKGDPSSAVEDHSPYEGRSRLSQFSRVFRHEPQTSISEQEREPCPRLRASLCSSPDPGSDSGSQPAASGCKVTLFHFVWVLCGGLCFKQLVRMWFTVCIQTRRWLSDCCSNLVSRCCVLLVACSTVPWQICATSRVPWSSTRLSICFDPGETGHSVWSGPWT